MHKTITSIYTERIILFLIILLFTISNFIWIYLNNVPPMWDQSEYLYASEVLYNTLIEKGLFDFFSQFIQISKTKAPLISIIPIPFYLLFGNSYKIALIINIFFLAVGNLYLYKLSKIFTDYKGALTITIVFNTIPLVFGLSREFLVEYGLTIIIIIYFYYLLKYDTINYNKSIIFGLLAGIGMLMKITFLVFIFLPTSLFFISNIKNFEKKVFIKNILLFLIISTMISSTWYFKNIKYLLNFIYSASIGELSIKYTKGILAYFLDHINYGLSFYYFTLAFLITFLIILNIFINYNTTKSKLNIKILYLLLWCIIPLITFSLIRNKELRLVLPIYPVFAIFIGNYIYKFFFYRIRLIYYMIILIGIINYFFISFYPINISKNIGYFVTFSNNIGWAHPPILEKWPNKEILKYLETQTKKDKKKVAVVTILFDHYYLSEILFTYLSQNMNINLLFTKNELFSNQNIKENIFWIKTNSDFVITKSDKLGEIRYIKNTPTIDMINEQETYYIELCRFYLPDNTYITIYKNIKRKL